MKQIELLTFTRSWPGIGGAAFVFWHSLVPRHDFLRLSMGTQYEASSSLEFRSAKLGRIRGTSGTHCFALSSSEFRFRELIEDLTDPRVKRGQDSWNLGKSLLRIEFLGVSLLRTHRGPYRSKGKARAGLSPCPRFTPGRIRTSGQRLRRPLLCPLSYGRMPTH